MIYQLATTGLAAYYNVKEGLEDDHLEDISESGIGINLVGSSDITWNAEDGALVIPKEESKMTISDVESGVLTGGNLTLEFIAKFNPEVDSGVREIIGNDNSLFRLSNSMITIRMYNDAEQYKEYHIPLVPGARVIDNKYHVFSLVTDPIDGKIKFYIDGVLSSFDMTLTGLTNLYTLFGSTDNIVLGGDGDSLGFVGRLKAFRIYDRALTESEIKANAKVKAELWQRDVQSLSAKLVTTFDMGGV